MKSPGKWYYLEDFVLATFRSIIWRFDAKSENPKGPVLVAFDKYCQMLHLLIFCQNLTPHMLSTSHNALKSQKENTKYKGKVCSHTVVSVVQRKLILNSLLQLKQVKYIKNILIVNILKHFYGFTIALFLNFLVHHWM